MIDDLTNALGEDVTITRVSAPAYDAWDTLDEANMTTTQSVVKAVLSQNTKEWELTDGGRIAKPELVITLPSGTDIRSDRSGRPDRVTVGGVTYEVAAIRTQTHPFTGAKKLQAALRSLPAR